MSYNLQAFICRQVDFQVLQNAFDQARKVDMEQGIALIPMTHELYNQMNSSDPSVSDGQSTLISENIERRLLAIIGNMRIAYVEAEYFGGRGGQEGIIWMNNKRDAVLNAGPGVINQVLKSFAVVALKGMDEFDTLEFGLNRKTHQWLE